MKTDAAAGAGPRRDQETSFKKSTVREYFESIVIAVILALFVRTFVVQAFKIPTGSMENNLLIGDHLLVNKFVFGPTASRIERALLPVTSVKRGDVIVFKYPEEPDRDFIKRTIGLRVSAEEEDAGLDITEHGMYGYPEQFIPAPELVGYSPAIPIPSAEPEAPAASTKEVTA